MKLLGIFLGLFSLMSAPSAEDLSQFYPSSYEGGREAFRKVAQNWKERFENVSLGYYLVPSTSDSDLTVDYIHVPAQKVLRNLIVVTSGVHGPESFVGSAVQVSVLADFLGELDMAHTGFLFVHAVNPYGFKYLRRQTEANIDLNRNMAVDRNTYAIFNEGYFKLQSVLEPQGSVGSVLLAWVRTVWGLGKEFVAQGFKMNSVNQAVAGGQYSSPQGLFYGGKEHEPQIAFLKHLFSQILPQYDRVVGLDFHTGLGNQGELHLMTGRRFNKNNYRTLVGGLFQEEKDRDIYRLTTGDTEGFYYTSGDMIDFLPTFARDPSSAMAFTAEYGTLGNGVVPKLQTITRMILENQGHQHGFSNAKIKNEVRFDFSELFNPSDLNWRKTVLFKGKELIKRVYNRMQADDRVIASEGK